VLRHVLGASSAGFCTLELESFQIARNATARSSTQQNELLKLRDLEGSGFKVLRLAQHLPPAHIYPSFPAMYLSSNPSASICHTHSSDIHWFLAQSRLYIVNVRGR
jgi:hypothetical protein